MYSESKESNSNASVKAIAMLKKEGLNAYSGSKTLSYAEKIFNIGKKSFNSDVVSEAYDALEELHDSVWGYSDKDKIWKYMMELV